MMKATRVALLAGIGLISATSAQAAAPTCTGTTTTIGSGGSATLGQVTGGNCVAVADKIFGSVTTSGAITGVGNAVFSFGTTLQGDVTVGFQGVVGANTTGNITYSVAINPALAGNFLIHDLQKDFTLNANPAAASADATLTGAVTSTGFGGTVNFDCTRTVNPDTSTCPVTQDFANLVTNLTVSQTLTTGDNAVVTAITDTISQQPIPEPGTLGMLATALIGMGAFLRRRRNTGSNPAARLAA